MKTKFPVKNIFWTDVPKNAKVTLWNNSIYVYKNQAVYWTGETAIAAQMQLNYLVARTKGLTK